jgi:hypothetical protein
MRFAAPFRAGADLRTVSRRLSGGRRTSRVPPGLGDDLGKVLTQPVPLGVDVVDEELQDGRTWPV